MRKVERPWCSAYSKKFPSERMNMWLKNRLKCFPNCRM
jgi:hypothetical protein